MIEDQDLTGFRLMHAGFRAEFGRLAQACGHPRDDAHELLLSEQLTLVLDMLHTHHRHEDTVLWPKLVARAPGSAPVLAELEAEHEVLDRLVAAAGDHQVPLAERAGTLRQLHTVVNDHLDHEERIAVPLMLAHLTPDDIEADKRQAAADFGRRRTPVIVGWLASSAEPALLASSQAELPVVVRLLFRLFWWPSYRRRFCALYGAPVPVKPVLGS